MVSIVRPLDDPTVAVAGISAVLIGGPGGQVFVQVEIIRAGGSLQG
jgi:hypothetical protein